MRDEHLEIAPYALRNRQACSLDIENPRSFSASIGERKNWERSDNDGAKLITLDQKIIEVRAPERIAARYALRPVCTTRTPARSCA